MVRGLHPRIKGCDCSPDHLLLRAYLCVLPNKSNQGCTLGSKRYTGPACCKYTDVCCRIIKLKASPNDQRSRPPAAAGTHMCVAEQINAELHRGSRFTKVWPARCCSGHTHVCFRTGEFRVAPKGQRLQRFGRAVVASCCCEHTHTCVCVCERPTKVKVTRVWPTNFNWEHAN